MKKADDKRDKENLKSAPEELRQRNRETSALPECSPALESLPGSGGDALHGEEVLQVIMDNTGAQLAYLDSDFNFVKVNRAYARGCGHAEEELIGKNHFALFPGEENRAVFEQVKQTGEPVTYHDKPFAFRDQPERGITYWDWTLAPVKGDSGDVRGLVLSLVDTTERVRAEERIKQAARQWQETFDAIPDMVSIHDRDYRIVRANRAFARAFGMTPEQLVGKACYQVYHKTGEPVANCPHEQMLKTRQPVAAEIFEPTRQAYFDVSTAPLFDADGQVYGSVHIARDISDRKRIENKLRVMDYAVTSAIDGIAIADLDGKITDVNLACLSLWDYEEEEVLGKYASAFFADSNEAGVALQAVLGVGERGRPYPPLRLCTCADGKSAGVCARNLGSGIL